MLTESPRKVPDRFSQMLIDKFELRKKQNSSYSMRAYARDLDISSGKLSDILNNNAGMTQTTAEKIALNLNLTAEDTNLFLHLVRLNALKNSSTELKALQNQTYQYDSSYVVLADDHYKALTEWYYFALADLVALKTFQNDEKWIAAKLRIELHQVRPAIESLKRIGLLREAEGRLEQAFDYCVSPSGTPSETAKKFHTQLLDKAKEALIEQPIEERDFTSGFLRMRKSDISYVAKRIKEFRRELIKELESGEGHDGVYAFSIQLFKIDNESSE